MLADQLVSGHQLYFPHHTVYFKHGSADHMKSSPYLQVKTSLLATSAIALVWYTRHVHCGITVHHRPSCIVVKPMPSPTVISVLWNRSMCYVPTLCTNHCVTFHSSCCGTLPVELRNPYQPQPPCGALLLAQMLHMSVIQTPQLLHCYNSACLLSICPCIQYNIPSRESAPCYKGAPFGNKNYLTGIQELATQTKARPVNNKLG